jgi:hypothetical protein
MQEASALRVVFLFGTVLVLSILPVFRHGEAAAQPLVGGPCEYKPYRGAAEVVSVTKIGSAENRWQDEYEVKCSFHPQEPIEEPFAQTAAREFRLLVDNGANPIRRFIEQYDIKVGERIPSVLRVIVRGTCTPVLFEYPWTGSAGK